MSGECDECGEHTVDCVCKLKILPTECACDRCSKMCRAPCCGTPKEINALIEAGYGDRLMNDDWPGGPDMIKPAMKGYEGDRAPWAVSTIDGCTFWKDGLCELHNTGLKPMQARLSNHNNTEDQDEEIAEDVRASWEEEEAVKCIQNWKDKFYKEKDDDQDGYGEIGFWDM